jgi:hypothetical protein
VLVGGSSNIGTTGTWAETWFWGAVREADAVAFGAACAGTSGPPVLTGTIPFLGQPALRLDVLSARPAAPCVFALAATIQNLNLGGGCTLYAGAPTVMLAASTSSAGVATVAMPIPLAVHLRGAVLYAQGAVADPLGPALGLAFTGGRRLAIGD